MSELPVLEKVSKVPPLEKVVPDLQKTSVIDLKVVGGPPPLEKVSEAIAAPSTPLTEAEVASRELQELQKAKVVEPVKALVGNDGTFGKFMVMRKGEPPGWDAAWVGDMDKLIGKVGVCTSQDETMGYVLKFEIRDKDGSLDDVKEFWFHPSVLQQIPESQNGLVISPIFPENVTDGVAPALSVVKKEGQSKVHLFLYGVSHSSQEVELVTVLKHREEFFQFCQEDTSKAISRCDGNEDRLSEGTILLKDVPPAVKSKGVLAAYELSARFQANGVAEDKEGVYTWFLLGVPITGMDNPINLSTIGSLLS